MIIILGMEILIFVLIFALLIYFIVKRIEDKKNENFENRDN